MIGLTGGLVTVGDLADVDDEYRWFASMVGLGLGAVVVVVVALFLFVSVSEGILREEGVAGVDEDEGASMSSVSSSSEGPAPPSSLRLVLLLPPLCMEVGIPRFLFIRNPAAFPYPTWRVKVEARNEISSRWLEFGGNMHA